MKLEHTATEWMETTFDTGAVHSFAIGDIHGHDAVLDAILKVIARTEKLSDDSHLVLLGDLIDRGPNSPRCVDLGMRAGDIAGVSKCTYLPGNHEQLMWYAIQHPTIHFYTDTWLKNGGQIALNQYYELTGRTGEAPLSFLPAMMDLLPADFIEKVLVNGPTHVRIGNIIFAHAGVIPGKPIEAMIADEHHNDDWTWIRRPFHEFNGGFFDRAGNKLLIVHGHEPVFKDMSLMAEHHFKYRGTPLWGDHMEQKGRINLDMGCGKMKNGAPHLVGFAEFHDGKYRLHQMMRSE
jgi:serine/threonine protein phosphatase 1